MNVPVSVIVCVHDEEQNLRELLPLLLSQNYSQFEIIIVEDRCNDGTYDFLLEETKKHGRLKMVHVDFKPEHINGKKFALTLGIKAAQHDWVLLTDSDCRPVSNKWIQQMAGGFQQSTDMVIGFSPYMEKPGLLNSFIRFETIVTAIQYFSFAFIGIPYMGVGRSLAYRKKLFLDNKGFNDYLSIAGGDDDLFVGQHATGQNVFGVLNKNSIIFSKPKTTWKEFYQQKVRHLAVGKRYKLKHRLLLAPFGLSNILFWPLIIASLFTPYWYVAIGSVLWRCTLQIATVAAFKRKSGLQFETAKIPFLDFIFCFYYLVAGFKALVSKRIKWKT